MMAQSAIDSLHENALAVDNHSPAAHCSQAADYPAATMVQETVSSAKFAGDGLQERSTGSACSTLLPTDLPELLASHSMVSEWAAAERTTPPAPSNEPQDPYAQPRDAESQRIPPLPGYSAHKSVLPFAPTESTHLDVVGNRLRAVANTRQPSSGHVLPPVTEALERQGDAMRELPPIRTSRDDMRPWPARPSNTKLYARATPVHAGSTVPATADGELFGSLQARHPGPVPAAEPSLGLERTTPQTLQSSVCTSSGRWSGGWPADFPQVLVSKIQREFRRRNCLSHDFNVLPNDFKWTDNRYYCPLCSEGTWKTVRFFFKHLMDHHSNSP